jgi:hypothetical protein
MEFEELRVIRQGQPSHNSYCLSPSRKLIENRRMHLHLAMITLSYAPGDFLEAKRRAAKSRRPKDDGRAHQLRTLERGCKVVRSLKSTIYTHKTYRRQSGFVGFSKRLGSSDRFSSFSGRGHGLSCDVSFDYEHNACDGLYKWNRPITGKFIVLMPLTLSTITISIFTCRSLYFNMS